MKTRHEQTEILDFIAELYSHKLPPATGTQAIDELAATVTVRNARHWSEYLTKWLVGVVANVTM